MSKEKTKPKGLTPYSLKNNKYVLALPHEINDRDNKDIVLLSKIKATHINNLLYSIKEIEAEIERIKKADVYCEDELIKDSTLSVRAKNACYIMFGDSSYDNKAKLSDIANIPTSEWIKSRNMGVNSIKEIKDYMKLKGFDLIEK